MKIKVLLVDDHQLFREGIATLLSSAENIEVIAQAEDGTDALEKVKYCKPDVVLLDIAMPRMNGIEATKKIKSLYPEVKIITLSMHSDKQYVKGVLEAGADGYLLKNCTYRQLTDAIQSVYDGKKYLSQDITEMVINGYLSPSGTNESEYDKLSEREKEIFMMFALGKSTREISDQLFISVKTVNTHKQNVLTKLKLMSNAELVKYALKNGLISFE
ncbi:MAG TPA: response regulator transcription factor [Draconibacterium sp.]|jgi:two-component system, NarL family, response regulator NreC|nr:response regulator transcription factor [Draconibacterium sp.]